jgi:hypothetical protein
VPTAARVAGSIHCDLYQRNQQWKGSHVQQLQRRHYDVFTRNPKSWVAIVAENNTRNVKWEIKRTDRYQRVVCRSPSLSDGIFSGENN